MAFTIRPALPSDAPDIGNLAKQFASYLRGLGDQTEFKLSAPTILRDGFGEQAAFSGIVAEENRVVLGYLLYHLGYDSDAAVRNLHIVDLYVERQARGRGVGTALMRAAAGIAVEAGARELIWSVYQHNGLAESFYGKLGAQRITEVFFMALPAEAFLRGSTGSGAA